MPNCYYCQRCQIGERTNNNNNKGNNNKGVLLVVQLSLLVLSSFVGSVDCLDTVLDNQFCQHYYTGKGDCEKNVRPLVRSEIRAGVKTLEMGDIDNNSGVMVFFHGWPDTSGLWSNQFEYFCNGVLHSYYCIAPSLMEFHPDGVVDVADMEETMMMNTTTTAAAAAPSFPNETQTLFWDIQVEKFYNAVQAIGIIDEIDLGVGDQPTSASLTSVLASSASRTSPSSSSSLATSTSAWAKLILKAKEEKNKKGGATFVTFDFGAIIGYQFAYRYPEMVKRMVAMDFGMSRDEPTPPFQGMEQYLPKYQRNNIDAYLTNDNDGMMDNIQNEINAMPSTAKFDGCPCSTCQIAPTDKTGIGIGVGIGAKTGWPYYQIIRTEMNTSFAYRIKHPRVNPNGGQQPNFGDLSSWEFNLVPSFPQTVPILYMYSDQMFMDDTYEEWIRNRYDGSQHKLIKNSDHWFQIRNSSVTNAIMDVWFTVLDNPSSQNIQLAEEEFSDGDDNDSDNTPTKKKLRPSSSATTVFTLISVIMVTTITTTSLCFSFSL